MLVNPITITDQLAVLHPVDRERVTTTTFTEVLRRHFGEDITAEVVHSLVIGADEVTASYLRVPTGAQVVRRRAVLRTVRSRRVAAYGQSLIVGSRLSATDRNALTRRAGDQRPLGDVLRVDRCHRQLLHWQVGTGAPYPGGRYLAEACRPGWPVISRHSAISGEEGPLALVGEWWPEFNPHAVVG